uniref:Uncharacterized protein n=1 Tax=Nelumbo nucifera TaxID=4432 RepID=A0A822YWD7_NELNU|nr:TPA_asm: hypothetical protein HUJ06_009045 [Nelumbo nucifera]
MKETFDTGFLSSKAVIHRTQCSGIMASSVLKIESTDDSCGRIRSANIAVE